MRGFDVLKNVQKSQNFPVLKFFFNCAHAIMITAVSSLVILLLCVLYIRPGSIIIEGSTTQWQHTEAPA